MSSKKEQKSDSIKKSDKMIDTHREFLDMDTDEEDFGRQGDTDIMYMKFTIKRFQTTLYTVSKLRTISLIPFLFVVCKIINSIVS